MKYFVSMNCCDFLYKRLYNNPEAGIHVPCWNYLHECSGVTGGGSAPLHFSLGNFMIYREKGGKEEREMERKRRKIWKESENLKMEGERYENEQRTSFLFCFFVFVFVFCLFVLLVSLFVFLLVTFWNHWNLFWVYQNGQFSWEKSYFMLGKKTGNLTLFASEKYSYYATAQMKTQIMGAHWCFTEFVLIFSLHDGSQKYRIIISLKIIHNRDI